MNFLGSSFLSGDNLQTTVLVQELKPFGTTNFSKKTDINTKKINQLAAAWEKTCIWKELERNFVF